MLNSFTKSGPARALATLVKPFTKSELVIVPPREGAMHVHRS